MIANVGRVREGAWWAAACLAMALATVAGSPARGAAQRLPEIEGIAVWDAPIASAPEPVRDAWEAYRALSRDRLAAPRGRTVDALGTWSRERLAPWLERRRVGLAELDRALIAIADRGGPREQLFASVLHLRAIEETVRAIEATPLPRELARDPALREAYQGALERALEPQVASLASAARRCAAAASDAPPPMQAWRAACEARAEAAEARVAEARRRAAEEEARRAARSTASAASSVIGLRGTGRTAPRASTTSSSVIGADRVPALCAATLDDPDPAASMPPIDRSAPLAIALVDESTLALTPAERARLLAALHRALARDARWPLVPLAALRRAERLVAERRWTERGPACGQAPPLAAILAPRFPNLAIAHVVRLCMGAGAAGAASRCAITVRVRRPGAPTHDEDLPASRGAEFEGSALSPASAWIAAAGRLREGEGAVGVLGTLDDLDEGRRFVVAPPEAGVPPGDPRLRVATTLRAQVRDAALACFDGPGIARFDVEGTIGPDGAIRDVRVRPDRDTLIGDDAEVEAVRACVERAIAATSWPCPQRASDVPIAASVCVGRAP